ncbi:MAG: hypothetical protein WAV23_02780 [Minisyncoccia bacterium]
MNRISDQNGGFIQAIISIIITIVLFYFVLTANFSKYFIDSFVSNMQRIHDGQPTDWQLAAPSVLLK